MTTETKTALFVDDGFAGDGLCCAEDEAHIHSPDQVTNHDNEREVTGAGIIESMRHVHDFCGGYYVISGDQVDALSQLHAWFAEPATVDARAAGDVSPPAEAMAVLRVADQIVTGPA